MYDYGEGVAKDNTQAVYWYRKSAEQGHSEAQYNLALKYYYGEGMAKDYKQAFYWYKKSAEQGHPEAQFNYGLLYYDGKGVALDDKQAFYWFRKSAEQGYPEAQYNLGHMYYHGRGVVKDDNQAVYWFRKSAEQGYDSAQYNLGYMYFHEEGVAKDYKQAFYWYKKSAEQGLAKAQHNLGYMYANGLGVAKDYIQAYLWVNLAAGKNQNSELLKKDLIEVMTRVQIAEAQRLASEWSAVQTKDMPKVDAVTLKTKHDPPNYTGSSFAVSLTGHLLTNRHVVAGCTELSAGGNKTKIVAEDPSNDLALLQLDQSLNTIASFREGRGGRIGEKVVVAGFPLRDVLGSGLNVTFGNVSSLTGIGNDSRMLQISAPVNPGNSGGPLIDDYGHIVGIVTSKLNALRTAKVTGDIPQGANFAIKSSIIRIFLDLNDVDYETSSSRLQKSNTIIAEEAKKYTLLIECWK